MREALSLGAWHRHHSGAAAMTAIGRRSKATRCLGHNVACQRPAGEATGEGLRRAAHRGLDGAPWRGAWPKFHRWAAQRGAEEEDGFGTITDTVSSRVCNSFCLRPGEGNSVGRLHAWNWAGDQHGVGLTRRKRPETLFRFLNSFSF
jgi:hypothetical protein